MYKVTKNKRYIAEKHSKMHLTIANVLLKRGFVKGVCRGKFQKLRA